MMEWRRMVRWGWRSGRVSGMDRLMHFAFAAWWLTGLACLAQVPAPQVLAPQAVGPQVVGPQVADSAKQELPAPHRHALHFEIMRLIDQLEPYAPPENVRGSVAWLGSKTMRELAERISIRFRRFHPEASFDIQTEGSETGLERLKSKPGILVGVSRMVRDKDAETLRAGGCKEPAMVVVGFEAMGIVVNKDNPIPSIGQEQLQAIFAQQSDGEPSAKTWGDLGVTGEYEKQAIVTYEREVTSGSQSFLLEMLESGSRLATPDHVSESNHEIGSAIAKDRLGIGLAGVQDVGPSLRLVPLVVNGEWVEPTEENVLTGRYPLMRPLFLVFDKAAKPEEATIRDDAIRFLLSRDGQLAVMNSGFFPLQAAFVQHQLNTVFGPQLR